MRDLLVIGSLNMDMVVRTPRIPSAGETVLGCFQAYVPGGKGANQAYACGRLGGRVAMLGKVGNDDFGDALTESLRTAGVDTALLGRCDQRTGQALIYVSDGGDNSIVVLPGANRCCDVDCVRSHGEEIANSRAVMLQLEIPQDAVAQAVRMAAERGKTVFLNPAPAARLPEELFPLVDYLTPNETELEALTGLPVGTPEEAEAAARQLLQKGVGHVLATLGSRGALLADRQGATLYPARPVTAVDTTAAGDTFNAAFAVRLMEGATQAQAVLFANAAASLSVSRQGAQPSIPSRGEVDAIIKEGMV